jgi:tight adherence protein B
LGHGLGPSLVAWSHAFPSAPVRLAVAAITLGIEAGGTTAQAVDSVASRIRDRLLLRREIAASSAQVRASVAVLVGAPPLAALVLGGLDGRALRFLFLAPAGWVLLAVSLGLDTVGWLWMRKLVAKVS